MSAVVLTPTQLVLNTASADIPDATSTAPDGTTSADGLWIPAASQNGCLLYLRIVETGSTTDTVLIKAGDKPPGQTTDLGDLSISLASGDVKSVVVETGRFLQSTGQIQILPGKTSTKVQAWLMPRNA